MLFRLSYPPFYAYSKPNHQVACACHYFNRQQHNNVILMDNGIPVKRQGNHTSNSHFGLARGSRLPIAAELVKVMTLLKLRRWR